MFHIVYRTTCIVNNKIYIGKHSTNILDDGYLGSGDLILAAIKKYGKENFIREILFIFQTEKDALDKEEELVTENFVSRDDNYNIALGGGNPTRGRKLSDETRRKMSNSKKGVSRSEELKKIMSEVNKGYRNPMFGKLVSEETRKKLSKASSGRRHTEETKMKIRLAKSGENHHFFGKKYTNEEKEKISKNRIKKTYFLLSEYDSSILECIGLTEFCRTRNVSMSTLFTYSKQNKFYKGLKIIFDYIKN